MSTARFILFAIIAVGSSVLVARAMADTDAELTRAVRENNVSALKAILVKVPLTDLKGVRVSNLLRMAAWKGYPEAVELLLTAGADASSADSHGTSALHLAAARGRLEIVKLLLAAGANPNGRDIKGATPLMYAAITGGPSLETGENNLGEVTRILIDAGADPNSKDKDGKTALAKAQELRNSEVAAVLGAYGHGDSSEPKRKEIANYRVLSEKAINRFGLAMYDKLGRGKENLVFSPFSVFSPLAIAHEGAQGQTRDEIGAALGIRQTAPSLDTTLGGLTANLVDSIRQGDGTLRLANGIWMDDLPGIALNSSFEKTVTQNYKAEILRTKFRNSDKAAREINEWVEEMTQGKITGLVSGPELEKAPTVLAIINAVYFKALWAMPFDIARTKDEDFAGCNSLRMKVPMMHHSSQDFHYMEEQDFQALELPYAGWGISMAVFLPKKIEGLAEFEKSFTLENFSRWLTKFSNWPYGVEVSLPRFTVRSGLRLEPTLQSMGIKIAFDSHRADFSGMLRKIEYGTPLFITKAIHEAWIEVNEKGTEAAAGTALPFATYVKKPEPKVFRADHPFMFVIYHKLSGSILFMGRVTNPLAN
jgi:serpin B